MKTSITFLVVMLSCYTTSIITTGCKHPDVAAYKVSKTVDISADAALEGWRQYVIANHPPVKDELKVQAAYDHYKKVQVDLLDVVLAYRQKLADDSSLNRAIALASTALFDLVDVIESFGVNLHKTTN